MLSYIIQHHRKINLYFLIWLLFLSAAAAYTLAHTKVEAFTGMNPIHSPFLDVFFIITSFPGDGIFILLLTGCLLITRRYTTALQLLAVFVISGVIAQLLKNSIPIPRPKVLLEALHIHYPYFLDGLTRIGQASFPSGHTTTVFAATALLALRTHNIYRHGCLIMVAVITGYSRIYLGHHFLEDVIAGSCIGIATAMVVHFGYSYRYERAWKQSLVYNTAT